MTRARVADLVARLHQGQQAMQPSAAGDDRLRQIVAEGLAAQHELVAGHMHLVPRRARSFLRKVGRSWLPDLMQQGWLGLRRASESFDPGRRVRFSTYAQFWIFQSMQRFLNQHRRLVRLPNDVVDEVLRLQRARARLRARHGSLGAAERAALARELKISEQRVGLLENIEREPQSLDVPGTDGGDDAGTDAPHALSVDAADENHVGPLAAATAMELREQLERMLGTLSFRQREVVKLRFGIGDGYEYTLEEIGRIFELTRERIRQIEEQALLRLRSPRHARILAAFLPGDGAMAPGDAQPHPATGVAPEHPLPAPDGPLPAPPACTAST